ncbi:MAG: NAD-dependent epimerase/dehydratase family protein [Thiogranum sp.]|nr:NAD-dependent epimerase/dehydratase family protein [Thiogranum sp.]
MSKLVAVTGATGFIGRTICRLLREDGWQVRALVRSPQGAQAVREVVDETVIGGLEDHAALARLVAGSFAVVHCAGAVRGATQQAFDRANVAGLENLVDAIAARDNSPRLLSLSSLAAREPDLSFYAASKRRGEQVLEQRATGLEWIALRPPAVYGPGDKELFPLFRLMARGIAPVPGVDGARFSMIYVDDIARAVLAWLQRDAVPCGVYSLHDGRRGGYGWSDVCDTVAALCQRRVRQVPVPPALLAVPAWINRELARWLGHAPMLTPEKLRELRHADWVCDNDAIEAALDWRPQVQLEAGLRLTPGWCASLRP